MFPNLSAEITWFIAKMIIAEVFEALTPNQAYRDVFTAASVVTNLAKSRPNSVYLGLSIIRPPEPNSKTSLLPK